MGRAFGIGGTSTLWGGQLVEFQESDLEHPSAPWPIDWNELKSLYTSVTAELGLPARTPDAVLRKKLRVYPAESPLEHFYTTWLPQPNFSVLWRKLLHKSERISIYLQQSAFKAHFEGARCVAIDAMGPGGQQTKFEGKQFLLALGTIGNAQFCLTQQKDKLTPFRDNPHVGLWFHDHLGGKVGDLRITNERRFRHWFENGFAGGYKLCPKLRFVNRPSNAGGLGVCGMFRFLPIKGNHRVEEAKRLVRAIRNRDLKIQIWRLPMKILKMVPTLVPLAWHYLTTGRIRAEYNGSADFCVQAEQLPIRESAIRPIAGKWTESGLMEVALDWRLAGTEAVSIRHFVKQAQSYFSDAGIGELETDPALLKDDNKLLEYLTQTNHQCGGLRMSNTPDNGVTRADGLIWSTDNLRVIGASVLPSSSYANCMLTALATTLKATRAAAEEIRK